MWQMKSQKVFHPYRPDCSWTLVVVSVGMADVCTVRGKGWGDIELFMIGRGGRLMMVIVINQKMNN